MAEGRALPARQHGGQPAPFATEPGVPDRVHAAVHDVEPTRLQPPRDRASAEPERAELLARGDSPLRGGELPERRIAGWALLCTDVMFEIAHPSTVPRNL